MNLFKNIKIIIFENFIRNSNTVINEIYDFLNVEHRNITLIKSNESKSSKFVKLNTIIYRISKKISKVDIIKKNDLLKSLMKKIIVMNMKEDKLDLVVEDSFYRLLYDYYNKDINRLENLIDVDLSGWKVYKNKYK